MGVSLWTGGTPAPDMSNVLKLAGRVGRMEGQNQFQEQLLQYQQSERERKLAAEKKAASEAVKDNDAAGAKALGDEPEHEGFWSNLGQAVMAVPGLEQTVDVLSRFNYAAANAAMYSTKREFAQGDVSWLQDMKNEISDMPEMLKAGWDGFKDDGQKTTFSQVIKYAADHDGKDTWRDNKWTQGIGGFAADVILDPTTYIGVGLVTKPLRLAKVKSVDKTLAHDVAGLGLSISHNGQNVKLTGEEIYSIIGRGDGFVVPKLADGVKLSRKEQKAWRKAHTIKGAYKVSQSEKVARVNRRMTGLEAIQTALRADPTVQTNDALKALQTTIDNTTHELTQATAKFSNEAYADVLRKLEESGKLPASPVGKTTSVTDIIGHVSSVGKLHKAFQAKRYLDKPTASSAKHAVQNQKDYDEAFQFLNDPRISPDFKKNHEKILAGALKEDTVAVARKRTIGALSNSIKRAEADLKANPGDATLTATLSKYQKKRNYQYEELNRDKARVLHSLIAKDYNRSAISTHPDFAEEYGDIQARISQLDGAVRNLSYERTGIEVHSSVDSAGDRLPGLAGEEVDELGTISEVRGGSQNEMQGVVQERAALNAELDAMEAQFISQNPEASLHNSKVATTPNMSKPAATASKSDKAKWARNVKLNIEKMADRIFDAKVKTAEREQRATGMSAKIFNMSGKKDDGVLRIPVGKTDKYLSVSENRKALEDMATTRDIKQFKSKANQEAGVPLAKIVFDREFKKNYGYTSKEVHELMSKEKGRAVRLGKADLSKSEYLDEILNNPAKYSRAGTGISIPRDVIPGAAEYPYKHVNYSKFVEYVAKNGGTRKEAEAVWDDAFADFVTNSADDATKIINSNWEYRLNAGKNKEKGITDSGVPTGNRSITEGERTAIRAAALKEATEATNLKTRLPDLVTKDPTQHIFKPIKAEPTEATLDETHKGLVGSIKDDHVQAVAAARAAAKEQQDKGLSQVGTLTKTIADLEKVKAERLAGADEAYHAGAKTMESITRRVDEQVLIDILADSVNKGDRYLNLRFAGAKMIDVPLPAFMVKATERLGHIKLIAAMNEKWSDAFNPASKLQPELNAARLDAQAGTPRIIKYHLTQLKKNFSKFKVADRQNAFRLVGKGSPPVGNEELFRKMEEFFEEFATHTSGKTIIDGEALTIREINHFLPDEFKFVEPRDGNVNDLVLTNGKEIIEGMRNLKVKTDPMRVMWQMSVAAEQAIAYKAMQSTIRKTFGIERAFTEVDSKFAAKGSAVADASAVTAERGRLIEQLQKNHDWKTVQNMGGKHYFPPEVASEIETLMKMMEPDNAAAALKLLDKVQGHWKAAVTIYNPGYYTRNGIGETIMGMMDGVTNPIWYARASRVMSFKKPDAVKEALHSLKPWAKRRPTSKQKGAQTATVLANGTKITIEDAHILYTQVNLKTGFVSSEYDHLFPTGGSLRSNVVGQAATKTNDMVRTLGESYEDYFRMAHFLNRMSRAPKVNPKTGLKTTPVEAAEWAVPYVRKYHFDYTDFTKFEKSTLMRIFPFYKWTRKSFPLMAGMMFTNPGKVLLYPKAMHNLSVATGGNEGEDTNGILPNYEDVTPEWMRNMFTYPIGRDGAGAMDYMNIANPQFDNYKMAQSPVNGGLGLLSPIAKTLLEQSTGGTLSADNHMRFDEVEGSRGDALMGITPASSFYNKIQDGQGVDGNGDAYDDAISEPGAHNMDETLTSFLTGLGFYENNERRQMGETFRTNIAKSKK